MERPPDPVGEQAGGSPREEYNRRLDARREAVTRLARLEALFGNARVVVFLAGAVLAWVVFGVLLFGRWRFGWRGRMARNWTLSGFALLGLAYFGSKIVLESILGRHWG